MSGLPEVDPDDWQANTVYSGDCYSEEHQVIKVTVPLKYQKYLSFYKSTRYIPVSMC